MSVSLSPVIGNKAELARALRCSVPTVNVMLERWSDFPIIERGTNGREYRFDIAGCIDFVQRQRADAERDQAERAELFAQMTLPDLAPTLEPGAVKASDQLALARVRQMHRREQLENGLLVPTTEVRQVLTGAFTRLRRAMDASITQAARRHHLADAVLRDIVAGFHEAQRAFVADTTALAASPDALEAQLALH